MEKLVKDKRGVFGLNAVQQFFIVVLGLALLAYIIVVIMGALQGTTILAQESTVTANLTGKVLNTTGFWIAEAETWGTTPRQGCVITSCVMWNGTDDGDIINSGNYTINSPSDCWIKRVAITTFNDSTVNVSCNIKYNSVGQVQTRNVLQNTSSGVTGFFSSVSPVYAILAVLVIILILVVLVRVVSSPAGGREQL